MGALVSTGRSWLRLFGAQRRIWLPFLLTAALEAFWLGVLWLAPQAPFSSFFAPPLQALFGRQVLHYPWHLLFLYDAMRHIHVLAATLLGAYFSGVACVMVGQEYAGQPCSLRDALVSRRVRYRAVTLLWLLNWAAVQAVTSLLTRVMVDWQATLLAVSVPVVLAYAIPITVFERAPWWAALGRSAWETVRHPLTTLIVVGLPSLTLIAFERYAQVDTVWSWMLRTAPETVCWAIAVRLLLQTLAGALLLVGVAHLWCLRRVPTGASPAVLRPSPRSTGRPAAALIGVTALWCMGVGVFGCSEAYQGERLLWKAHQLSRPIVEHPSGATAQQYARALEAFARVWRAVPGTVWAGRAQHEAGRLYALQGDYDTARAAYNQVLVNYRQYPDLCIDTYLDVAKSYEAQQRWDDVVTTFATISDVFRWSDAGLQAPMWIAQLYDALSDAARAAKAYDRAALAYTQWLPNTPSVEMANRVRGYLVTCYQRLGRWDRAAAVLEHLSRQTAGVDHPAVLMTLATIYETRLGDLRKSRAVYERLAKDCPDQPAGQEALWRLQEYDAAAAVSARPSAHGAMP